MLSRLIVVVISQYIEILNYYVVCLKHIILYVSYISSFEEYSHTRATWADSSRPVGI